MISVRLISCLILIGFHSILFCFWGCFFFYNFSKAWQIVDILWLYKWLTVVKDISARVAAHYHVSAHLSIQQSLLEGCTVIWNERTLQLSRLVGNQLYYSVSVSGGLKFLIREFGWARASRGSSWTSSWHTDEVVFGNLKAWDKSTMTSTNMFQGLDTGSKPSSRWAKKWSSSFDVHDRKCEQCLVSIAVGQSAIKLGYCSVTNVSLFATSLSATTFTRSPDIFFCL